MIETQISTAEYFDELHESEVKLEYHAGEIVAMAGAQPSHNRIAVNLITALADCLEKNGCEIFNSDQLIKLEACKKYVFPDLVIVCEEPIFEMTARSLEAFVNPNVVIEILSDSTALFDRTEKLDCYQALESLKEYILVSSDRRRIETFKRLTENEWLQHIYTAKDQSVAIDNCEVLIDEIYKRVQFSI